jgi:hypothetical protein
MAIVEPDPAPDAVGTDVRRTPADTMRSHNMPSLKFILTVGLISILTAEVWSRVKPMLFRG